MDNRRALEPRITLSLILILVVSVLTRLAACIYLGNQVVNLPGTYDQISYHNLALRLLDGHGFSFGVPWWPMTAANAPTAHWSYLYTFYLTFIYSIFGPNPIAARVVQAIIVGILQPLFVFLIGRRVFNPIVGLLGAGITAVYIYFIYYAGTLMTEPFYITAILVSLYLAMVMTATVSERERKSYRWVLAIALGVTLSIAVLLRQLFILVIPFIFLWIWWSGRDNKAIHSIRTILITCTILFLVIAPITVYNYQRFNRFVLLNTNAGFAFFWGNHPIYGIRFIPLLPARTYQDLVPQELRDLDEAALDQALLKRAVQFILDDPVRYILLSLSRIPPYFMFWPSRDSETISNITRVGSFGLFLPFMIYGLILAIIRLPRNLGNALASPVSLLIGFALIYTAIHLSSWVLIRYRLPVDAVLILFAGLAIFDLYERIGARLRMKRKLQLSSQP